MFNDKSIQDNMDMAFKNFFNDLLFENQYIKMLPFLRFPRGFANRTIVKIATNNLNINGKRALPDTVYELDNGDIFTMEFESNYLGFKGCYKFFLHSAAVIGKYNFIAANNKKNMHRSFLGVIFTKKIINQREILIPGTFNIHSWQLLFSKIPKRELFPKIKRALKGKVPLD
jgi:hypothetical protein